MAFSRFEHLRERLEFPELEDTARETEKTEPARSPAAYRVKRSYNSLVPPPEAMQAKAEDQTFFLGDGRLAFREDHSYVRAIRAYAQFTGWIQSNASESAMAWLMFRTACTMRNMLHRMNFANAGSWLASLAEIERHQYDVRDDLNEDGLLEGFWTAITDPRIRRERSQPGFGSTATTANIDVDD